MKRALCLIAAALLGCASPRGGGGPEELRALTERQDLFTGTGVAELRLGEGPAYAEARRQAMVNLAEAIGVHIKATYNSEQTLGAGEKNNLQVVETVTTSVDRDLSEPESGLTLVERSFRDQPKGHLTLALSLDRKTYLAYLEKKAERKTETVLRPLREAASLLARGEAGPGFEQLAAARRALAAVEAPVPPGLEREIERSVEQAAAALRLEVRPSSAAYGRDGRTDPVRVRARFKFPAGEVPAKGLKLQAKARSGRARLAASEPATGDDGSVELPIAYVDPSFSATELVFTAPDAGESGPSAVLRLSRGLKGALLVEIISDGKNGGEEAAQTQAGQTLRALGISPLRVNAVPSPYEAARDELDLWTRISAEAKSRELAGSGFFTASATGRVEAQATEDGAKPVTTELPPAESGAFASSGEACRAALERLGESLEAPLKETIRQALHPSGLGASEAKP